MTNPRRLAAAWPIALVLAVVAPRAHAAPPTVPVTLELVGPGENVDDVCFWVNRVTVEKTLAFVTVKDSGTVQVFRAATGEFIRTIGGFDRPNNCAVVGDLLLTTDSDAGEVVVHHIQDFALVRRFGQDMTEPEGIDVLTRSGQPRLAYVTDADDASVHVYDVDTGALVDAFPTDMGDGVEPILVDDLHERVYVARGEGEPTFGIGVFTLTGDFIEEIGEDVFSRDAEGMAIYACGAGGYLVAADQRSDETEFEVFDRVSLAHLGTFRAQDGSGEWTNSTDGLDILQTPLPGFPSGMLAACDGCGSSTPEAADVISWEAIASALGLQRCPRGQAPGCGALLPARRPLRSARAG